MTLLETQHIDAHVDHYGLGLQDADDAWLPTMFPEGFTRGPFVSQRPGRIDLTSAGHTQTVSFDAEIWSAVPTQPDGKWDEFANARIECRSGELRLWSVTGGPAAQSVALPREPMEWNVRIYCRGRANAAQACLTGVPQGVERYLAQFWAG
ncbi:hypothetical protein [Streptomyces bikiniensis]|uniref:hypothetical protein n=1 Tax=Streptomyces bikiniensis TaxID=1896 RepID=UPI00068EB40F|nr:hypothetical protein [Streptomyces bikiniensis]